GAGRRRMGTGVGLRPPMRCLRLGSILQSSAPPTPQAVDPIENAGGPPATRACEPLAVAAKYRKRGDVGHEKASELTPVIAFYEPDTSRARNDAQLVEPTMIVLPRYGPDTATHDRLEQSHTLEFSQIDAAPMLNLARCAELKRSP